MTQNESDRYLGDSGHHKEDQGGSTKSKSSLVTPMVPFSPYTFFVTETLCLCNIQYSRGGAILISCAKLFKGHKSNIFLLNVAFWLGAGPLKMFTVTLKWAKTICMYYF